MKTAALTIESPEQARRFDELLEEYQCRQGAPPVGHISLESVFVALKGHPEGGRMFTYFLELQVQLAFLNCDLFEASKLLEPTDQVRLLSDPDAFCRKAALQRANSDYVFRYRAIWDKIMALIVLLRVPADYQRYASAKSKKRTFQKIADQSGRIPRPLVRHVIETTTAFDQKYRTEEAHGSGSTRKWSFVYLEGDDSPQDDMFWAWNSLNAVLARLGEAFRNIAGGSAA